MLQVLRRSENTSRCDVQQHPQHIHLQLIIFSILMIAYGSIWIKMKRTADGFDTNEGRYRSSASIMLIFVITFIFQWWPLIFYHAWTIGRPTIEWWPVITGSVCNLGGVWNCIAYTIIRRRLRKQDAANKPKVSRINLSKNDLQKSTVSLDHI